MEEEIEITESMKILNKAMAITVVFVMVLPLALMPITNSPAAISSLDSSFVLADQAGLPTRGNMGMVYDNESDLVVIFGGWNTTGDPWNSTWTYDYNSDEYAKLHPSVSPPGRAEPGLTYDSVRDQVILFGGEDNLDTPQQHNDTWIFDVDTNTWAEVFPTIAPSPRRGHFLAFDSESDRVILFGGRQGVSGPTDNDTWAYNPGTNEWQMMSPATAPDKRFAHSMVYDSESDRVILFSGLNGGDWASALNYFEDTWAYDFNTNTWEAITTTTQPSPRAVPTMAYDSESDRIVLFGGSMWLTTFDDTWLFDYNTLTWQEMNPAESPAARSRHGSAYDWESDRVIIYSGTYNGFQGTNFVLEGKTWAYDVNTNTWEHIGPIHTTTTTTTTTTTEPPPPPPPIDPVLLLALGGGALVVIVLIAIVVRRR
ncbi:MAG: Kelch repeat-containing protein [Candidatus Thorarchaeota archaeon]